MLVTYLGIYTLFVALLWGLFIVAKLHAYKFKNFSPRIPKLTHVLLIFLLILTILGYVLIFFGVDSTTVVENFSSDYVDEVNY